MSEGLLRDSKKFRMSLELLTSLVAKQLHFKAQYEGVRYHGGDLHNLGDLFGHVYDNVIETISLKAPQNYSASMRSNRFSLLLLEGPKTSLFMISGFWTL